jgi:VWFA-related protein
MVLRKTCVFLVAFLSVISQAHGQDAGQAAPAAPDAVIKVSVKLVQVDATVTDAQGHPVRDLRAQDFEILQDGKPQTITNFSFISPATAPAAAAHGNTPSGNPNKVRFEDVRRTIALVVDDLGLSFETTARVQQALRRYVDTQLQPGDLVAVLRTGAGVGALQQFTTDRQMLYAAIDRVRYNPQGGMRLSTFAPVDSHVTNVIDGPQPSDVEGGQGQFDFDQTRREIYVAGSLGAVRYVVDGLRGLPGRKELVLFSENTQITFGGGGGRSQRAYEGMRSLLDAANRAGVVVYAIDPGGLRTRQLTEADDTARSDPQELLHVSGQREDTEWKSREGMAVLSEATGGLFLHDSNDLHGLLQQALDDSATYYLIGYRPTAETFDAKTGQPKFHTLKIRVLRPGLHVRSRSGFFGVEEDAKPPAAGSPREEMLRALTSPFSSGEIHVRLTALFQTKEKVGAVLATMLYIDPRELHFTRQADGSQKASFETMVVTFDEDGAAVDSSGRTFVLQAKSDEEYANLLKTGVVYVLQHPAKKPGPYQMRVAVRDTDTGAIGSSSEFIQVPELHRGHLTLSSITLTQGQGLTEDELSESSGKAWSNTPAVRVFKPGDALVYMYQALDANVDGGKQASLEAQMRLFRNGELIFTGSPAPPVTDGASTPERVVCGGAMQLGPKMTPGDYVLQVAVRDKLAKSRRGAVTQAIDFEVKP